MSSAGIPMVIGRLPDVLHQRGISRRELTRRTRLSRATIAKLCTDAWVGVDRWTLAAICTALHVPLGQLLTVVRVDLDGAQEASRG
jgi:DNA-binding Xre family transcriptional regulator